MLSYDMCTENKSNKNFCKNVINIIGYYVAFVQTIELVCLKPTADFRFSRCVRRQHYRKISSRHLVVYLKTMTEETVTPR